MLAERVLTEDVRLRLVREDDADALARAYSVNREHLAPWDPLRPERFFTAEQQHIDVRGALDDYEGGIIVPLVLTAGGSVVGRVTLSSIVRGAFQNCHLGYWIAAELQGRGVMTAAVAEAVSIARSDLGLHRIEAGTLIHTVASQRVLRANGFVEYGLAPQYLKIAGLWQDHRMFQRLLHD